MLNFVIRCKCHYMDNIGPNRYIIMWKIEYISYLMWLYGRFKLPGVSGGRDDGTDLAFSCWMGFIIPIAHEHLVIISMERFILHILIVPGSVVKQICSLQDCWNVKMTWSKMCRMINSQHRPVTCRSMAPTGPDCRPYTATMDEDRQGRGPLTCRTTIFIFRYTV